MDSPSKNKNKPLEILVVDDDVMWRHFVRSTLELEMNISPVLASTGQEALDILATRPFDVVIADAHMPVMNGFQFLLLARLQFPATRVIIMSADSQAFKSTSWVFIEAGAVAIIPKVEIASNLVNLLRSI